MSILGGLWIWVNNKTKGKRMWPSVILVGVIFLGIWFTVWVQKKVYTVDVVARTIYWEARGEGMEGRLAVAAVIMNRSQARGLDLVDTCFQFRQFSCWDKLAGWRDPISERDIEIFRECRLLGWDMALGCHNVMGPWTDYHATRVHPAWSDHMRSVKVIGNHKFGIVK